MAKLKQIDVLPTKKGNWVAKKNGKKIDKAVTKSDLVGSVTKSVKSKGKPTSVRIHKKNGQIQEERTYPRGADPKKSKG